MRFVEKETAPSETVGPFTKNRKWGKYPAPQHRLLDQFPVFITEEMEKELLAKGET